MDFGTLKSKVRHIPIIISFILVIVFVCSTSGVISIVGGESESMYNVEQQIIKTDNHTEISEVNGPIIVASTQGFPVVIQNGDLVAFLEKDGTVVYHESRYGMYFDIDPVKEENYTVRFAASERLEGNDCSEVKTRVCTRSVYEEVNMSTGERKIIYSDKTPHVSFTRWHDVHRVNDTHIAVASIYKDGVYFANTETGNKKWIWNATEQFERPSEKNLDWTHLNDVSVLQDGDLVLSLRNQDQVVFIERTEGGYVMNESRTLGQSDEYRILYEQHNPDYIPREDGGPALLVGDSENNRIVEYQRTEDGWRKTFNWIDRRMQWPRDADRLDGGNTLITDTNGERVMEVNKNGEIVWSANVGRPYESEKLGTVEESSGNSYQNVTNGDSLKPDYSERPLIELKYILPRSYFNALLFISPHWMVYTDLIVLSGSFASALVWISGIVIVNRAKVS